MRVESESRMAAGEVFFGLLECGEKESPHSKRGNRSGCGWLVRTEYAIVSRVQVIDIHQRRTALMATVPQPASFLSQRSELVLAAALLGLLVVMIVPLPPALLDLLLALNLALTLLLILVTLGVKQPLDFSVFPSLLLLLTLFRL